MEKDDRKIGGAEQTTGSRQVQRASRPAPGKVTRTSQLSSGRASAVQRKTTAPTARPAAPQARSLGDFTDDPAMDAAHRGLSALAGQGPVQASGDVAAEDPASVHRAAAAGVSGAGGKLPYLDQIQKSFGNHDIGGVQAHVGSDARTASAQMGAEAYATGNHIAFGSQPDLHTAAHEAAHVVQQRAGVQLADGVGTAGDAYERQADAIADRVVAGESAVSLLGSSGAADAATSAGVQKSATQGAAVQMRDSEREREGARERDGANGELDRRLSGTHGAQEDGSGGWGAESDDRGVTDRANHYMWSRVALAAESWGLTNAARHMRHYLGNTGARLDVNPDLMLRDVAPLQEAYDARIADLRAQAEQHANSMSVGGPVSFPLSTPRMSDVYCNKSISADWFYAIGGFTYWVTAEVTLTPTATGEIQATMVTRLHIFDRYNWDGGKSVTIGGITVTDEQLGRLHRVGLAREYEVHGTSSPRTTEWIVSTNSSNPVTQSGPSASGRQGGRSDPSRERGRHVDNVRGSE